MNRKDLDKDTERPHYYSTYWIEIAQQFSGQPVSARPAVSVVDDDVDEEDDEDLTFPITAEVNVPFAADDIDEIIPVPRPAPKPIKPQKTEQRPATLSSLADLAALSFGADAETEDLAIGADDEEDAVISRLGSAFDDDIEPNEEEAASLESLSEDEDWDDDEEEDDEVGGRRRRPAPPPKPARRPPPRRVPPTRDF